MSQKIKIAIVLSSIAIALLVTPMLVLLYSFCSERSLHKLIMAESSDGPWTYLGCNFVIMRCTDGKAHAFWVFNDINTTTGVSLPTFQGINHAAFKGDVIPNVDQEPIWGKIQWGHNKPQEDTSL